MALSANTVWEVRTGGNDVNGGGFVTGASGTDYSQQNGSNTSGSNISTADAVTAATTTVTSLTANFSAAIVGNVIYLAGGTGSLAAGWYQVTAFTNSTTITVDRAPGVSASVTMNIGGALGSPGGAGFIMNASGVAGMHIYIATGTYTLTNTTANTSQGPVVIKTTATDAGPVIWEGYNTSRGDLGTPPVISSGAQNNFTFLSTDGTSRFNQIKNITVDAGVGANNIKGIDDGTGRLSVIYLCNVKGCRNRGFSLLNADNVISCTATTCSDGFFIGSSNVVVIGCESYNNVSNGFNCSGGGTCVDCLSYGNTGAGFALSSSIEAAAINCTSYNNGGNGFQVTVSNQAPLLFINCIAEKNSSFGFGVSGTTSTSLVINCATFSNTSGGIDPKFAGGLLFSNVAYTATAFVNAASNNFALNNNAGGGASVRALGFPGTMPRGTSIGFIDIGAIQHKDTPATNIFIIDD